MTTKLGRMVADFNGLLLIKSHHSLIKLSCTITKIFISPLPKCIWQPNVTECWLTLRSFISQCYSALCSCGLSISLDKLKPLYIHYHNLLGYPTWKGGNLLYLYSKSTAGYLIWEVGHLLWKSSTNKVTQAFEDVVMWGYVKIENIICLPPQCLWPQNSRLLHAWEVSFTKVRGTIEQVRLPRHVKNKISPSPQLLLPWPNPKLLD